MAEPHPLIPVSAATIGARECDYVLDCLRSTWISSRGEYIPRFEAQFARVCGARHAVACNNGTAALHLALLAIGIGPGDEVIVPTLTYVASANAVRYCGGEVKFADSLPGTWNMDPEDVKREIGPNTKAIMAVHLYGEPADMAPLLELADEHGLSVVEDAAEAHGATYGGRPVGAIGRIGTFSFYGNKIITTGEGGMVVTNDDRLAERCLLLRGQGQAFDRTYWFPVIGYNYRMTNIEAAIGLAQVESLEDQLARRRSIATRYRENLGDVPGLSFQASSGRSQSANWMVGVLLPVRSAQERDGVASDLREWGIETRPFFYPIHTMPPYADRESGSLPIATDLSARGICLPTWGGLSDSDVDYVSERLTTILVGRSVGRGATPHPPDQAGE
ncbi:MAG: DegT/DnrJ/EryC1/StrS family aminotransferase [Actinomycetota bacterium]